MFEALASYSQIVVTGCQRSGTRIAAKIIAADTGHTYLDEGWLVSPQSYPDDVEKAQHFLAQGKVVLHGPALACDIVQLSGPDTLIVWVHRDPAEIRASMDRIKWKAERVELAKYNSRASDIIPVKQAAWEKDKPKLEHWLEINYASLAKHPLFIAREQRKDFRVNQTKL